MDYANFKAILDVFGIVIVIFIIILSDSKGALEKMYGKYITHEAFRMQPIVSYCSSRELRISCVSFKSVVLGDTILGCCLHI